MAEKRKDAEIRATAKQKGAEEEAQAEAKSKKPDASSTRDEIPPNDSEGAMGSLEDEADQEGAFDPETGEINWDCPCLGGMAHGPCGEEFKAAFSCFVYSKEESKGIDCIDKFQYVTGPFFETPALTIFAMCTGAPLTS